MSCDFRDVTVDFTVDFTVGFTFEGDNGTVGEMEEGTVVAPVEEEVVAAEVTSGCELVERSERERE